MIHLGVLSYGNPDVKQKSNNIGDFVQSLASLNVYRHFVRKNFDIDLDMETFVNSVINNTVQGIKFVFLDRDNLSKNAAAADLADKKIYTIMNGWWCHYIGPKQQSDWPPPDNIIPIFVSFHIARPDIILSEKGCAYLKKYEPIGCRDLNTVKLLEGAGIGAYFSGCLTMTIDFFRHDPSPDVVVYIVDVEKPSVPFHPESRIEKVAHCRPEVKTNSLGRNLLDALALLKKYSQSTLVVTSRIHCYLPLQAMNVPCVFQHHLGSREAISWGPSNRFEGLVFNVKPIDISIEGVCEKIHVAMNAVAK